MASTVAEWATIVLNRRAGVFAVALFVLAAVRRPALAATVTAEVSSREVLPGEAFQLSVKIEGTGHAEAPQLPAMPDFKVTLLTPTPQQSSFTQIINGRFSSWQTLTYVYELRAKRTGRLTIPAISVKVDGEVQKTQAVAIVVAKGETSDLLFVEFVASRSSVFVEQPFDLTLAVWVRPYKQGELALTARQMLSLFKSDSDFGEFAKEIAEGQITVRRGFRKDSEGQDREYYVYEVKRRVWPDKPGPYRPEPVTVIMTYPIRLARDVFRELRLERRRQLVEQAKPPKLVVKPIPEEGRPAAYNGAIGRYDFKVWADRTDVRRGQLVTLTMEITGEGLLERVPAPPLSKVPDLTKHFKVLDEQLAGEMKADEHKKIFRQKIRAVDDQAKVIPPIPFVFFDPDADDGKGRFVTVRSEPIPITVHAAETVTSEDVLMPAAIGPSKVSLLTEAADSIRANYTEAEGALASQVFAPGAGWAASVAAPPMIWLVGWTMRRRSDRLRTDVALARRRSARKNAEARLRAAAASEDPADGTADALLNYIADRANLPAGGLTRPDAVRRLRQDNVGEGIVDALDKHLAACEEARYAGVAASSDRLVEQAQQCLRELERSWKPKR